MNQQQKNTQRPACDPEIESPCGNYFVSTYPPFSSWQEDESAGVHRLLNKSSARPRTPLGLYTHIPFCLQRCLYCYYLSSTRNNPDHTSDYIESVIHELALYRTKPYFQNRHLDFVYFGGGTPSMLPVPQVGRLIQGMKAAFPWDQAWEVSFECAPKSVNAELLQLLKDEGVNRISLGVQQINDAVLKQNGRIHGVKDILQAYALIRECGFQTVNVDLMTGMAGENDATFMDSLSRTLRLRPDSVTIYQMEIPKNTPLHRMMERGHRALDLPSWTEKRARLERAFLRLEAEDYEVCSAYMAVKKKDQHPFIYQDAQYRGADMLGLGASSFSYLSGVHFQNNPDIEGYLEQLKDGQLPLHRSHVLSVQERQVREFILQLKLGAVDAQPFQKKFGINLFAQYDQAIHRLAERGLIKKQGCTLELTRRGLLQVDRLLPEFYLLEHQGLRYS